MSAVKILLDVGRASVNLLSWPGSAYGALHRIAVIHSKVRKASSYFGEAIANAYCRPVADIRKLYLHGRQTADINRKAAINALVNRHRSAMGTDTGHKNAKGRHVSYWYPR